jgi:hypothetical protein
VTLPTRLLHLLVPAAQVLDHEHDARAAARSQLALDGLPALPEATAAPAEPPPVVTEAQALAVVQRLLGGVPV